MKKLLFGFLFVIISLTVFPCFISGDLRNAGQAFANNLSDKEMYIRGYTLASEGKFKKAIALLSQIPPESPFYQQAQEKIQEWEKFLKDPGTTPQMTPSPHQIVSASPRTLELQGQFQNTLPLSGNYSAGGGLGATYFLTPSFALHGQFNIFPSAEFVSFFIPFSGRYYFQPSTLFDIYIGTGPFLSIVTSNSQSIFFPLGGLIEIGSDYHFTPKLSLGLNLNYGMTFTPTVSQTAGGRFEFKYAL